MSPNLAGALLMMASMACYTLNDTLLKFTAAAVPLFQLILFDQTNPRLGENFDPVFRQCTVELSPPDTKIMEHMDPEAIVPMLEVHEAYLERALAAIAMSYPSLENYLEEALGVGPAEVAELKGRYVEG